LINISLRGNYRLQYQASVLVTTTCFGLSLGHHQADQLFITR